MGLKDKVAPPEMDERCYFWMDTFDLLSSSRPVGHQGAGPIPLSEIRALLDLMPLPCAADELISVIRAMDIAFLDHVHKRKAK